MLEGLPPCRPLSRLQDFLCVSLSSHAHRVASTSFTALVSCSKQSTIHTGMVRYNSRGSAASSRAATVMLPFSKYAATGLKKNMNVGRKFISVKDQKIRALLFAHSFEAKFGFGFGFASCLKTRPESALRKHHISTSTNGVHFFKILGQV